MGVTVGFSLQQFSEVLKIRDAAGQPYLLIGGQAVNYWAERYLAVEPQLESLQPFTSEDINLATAAPCVPTFAGLWPAKPTRRGCQGCLPSSQAGRPRGQQLPIAD
jgi:hypothetical protein